MDGGGLHVSVLCVPRKERPTGKYKRVWCRGWKDKRFVTTGTVAALEFWREGGDRWERVYVTLSTDGHRDTNSSQNDVGHVTKRTMKIVAHNTARK